MKTIKFQERGTENFQKGNIKGLNLRCVLAAKEVSVDLLAQDSLEDLIDIDAITIKMTLRQFGVEREMWSGPILSLLRHMHYRTVKHNFVKYDKNAGAINGIVLSAAGAAAKNVVLIPLEFEFDQVINLVGDDLLKVEYNVPLSAAGVDIDTAVSYLSLDTIEGIGVQAQVPMYKAFPIQANEKSLKMALGENVMKVSFINLADGFSETLEKSKIIDRVVITANNHNETKTYYDLLQARLNDFLELSTLEPSLTRGQSFILHQGGELDNCKIEIDFNSANVSASENFIVVETYETDPALFERAKSMAARNRALLMQKTL